MTSAGVKGAMGAGAGGGVDSTERERTVSGTARWREGDRREDSAPPPEQGAKLDRENAPATV